MKIGVLFDLDGTLLDSLQDLCDAVNYILKEYGCPQRTLEEVRSFVGTGARNLIRLSLPGKDTDPDVDQVLIDYQNYYNAHARIKTCPYEGVVEALQTVAEKYPVAVVSNKPDAAVKLLCADFFPGIYGLGEVEGCPRKPAPDMLRKAMAVLGVDTCVYVGDSEVDVLTAQNTGVPCLSVLWGFRDRKCLEEAGGKYFCSEAKTLPAMIDMIIEEQYGK